MIATIKMTVDKATADDLRGLAILLDEYRIFYNMQSDVKKAEKFLLERINKNDSVIFVSQSEGVLTGFIQLYPLFSTTRLKRLWLLNDLYVNPKFRGLKVSIKLIDKAKQLAKETNSAGLLLETAKSNTIGNKLYQKTGFHLDTDHHYYSWNE